MATETDKLTPGMLRDLADLSAEYEDPNKNYDSWGHMLMAVAARREAEQKPALTPRPPYIGPDKGFKDWHDRGQVERKGLDSADAPLRLEAGKYYRSRDGRKMGPIREDAEAGGFGWFAGHGGECFGHYGWNSAGIAVNPEAPDCDLISEWVEDKPAPAADEPLAMDGATAKHVDELNARIEAQAREIVELKETRDRWYGQAQDRGTASENWRKVSEGNRRAMLEEKERADKAEAKAARLVDALLKLRHHLAGTLFDIADAALAEAGHGKW